MIVVVGLLTVAALSAATAYCLIQFIRAVRKFGGEDEVDTK